MEARTTGKDELELAWDSLSDPHL